MAYPSTHQWEVHSLWTVEQEYNALGSLRQYVCLSVRPSASLSPFNL